MTTAPPPTFYFLGIEFNPSFFEDASSTLTKQECDQRYLIKIEQDTATALETFTGGIKTNSIENVLTTDISNILINSTGNINIGTSASRTTSNPIIIGNSTNSIIRLGNTGLSFSTAGTPTATLQSIVTATISIQTPAAAFNFLINQTGILNIGTATNRNADINIANTQTTGTGNIVIGSAALTTGTQNITINRPLTINYTSASSFNQLGYFQQFYSNNITILSSTSFTQIWDTPSLPIGIYNITYQLYTVPSTPLVFSKRFFGITSDNTGVSFPATAYQEYGKAETFNTNTTESFNTTIKVITSGIYYFLFKATFSSGAGTIAGFINVTRIG
jgi:hypothetical protein